MDIYAIRNSLEYKDLEEQDAKEVADAIERLLNNKALYNSIVDYQRQEKKGNTDEIEKFYQLLVQ